MNNILILDDEPDIRELLSLTLERMDLSCTTAATLKEAISLVSHNSFDLCLTDMRLPDGMGIELVKYAQQHCPSMPIAVITAYGNTDMAVDCLKSGAFDFISKPVDLERLRTLVRNALEISQLADKKPNQCSMLGTSSPIQKIRKNIQKFALSQAPVYIHGESGTGKELAARMIHEKGPRNEGPFIAINCGAIPSELMESEFFGHKRGSFTGAEQDKTGLFQAAHGGTLFLDEVAELPLDMQVKLLRAIQERAIRVVGEQQEQPVDVRILSATNKNLAQLVETESFRKDLFYRLNVISLELPPLKDRTEDIPELAQYFLDNIPYISEQDRPQLTANAIEALKQYNFPGNIRELENIIERATALSENGQITEDDLQLPQGTTSPRSNSQTRGQKPLEDYIADIEQHEISVALNENGWNRPRTAEQLGLTLRQLRYKMTKLGIEK